MFSVTRAPERGSTYEVVDVKRSSLAAAAVLLILILGIAPVLAATEEEIENSIELGLGWLALQQQPDGSWDYGSYDPGVTGLVLLKFEDRAKELGLDPLGSDYQYHSTVQKGLNYLFKQMSVNGDTISIPSIDVEVYYTSVALMALSASNNPDTEVGILGSAVDGMQYDEVAQGLLNFLVDAQLASGCNRGGWGYVFPSPTWADQSNTGYAVLGLTQAQAAPDDGFGLAIPAATKTELLLYLDTVQASDGSSMYNPCYPYDWRNILKTGSLLQEHAFAGTPATDPAVLAATGYIEDHWNDVGPTGQPMVTTSLGWKDSYQAMFCMMKGLESYSIDLLDLDGNGVPEADWFDLVSTQIVDHQNPDGSFQYISPAITEGEQNANIRAAWALLTLEKFVPQVIIEVPVDMKPGSCPNSYNIGEKGVLPAAILGTDEFDVQDIDPATIRLVTCNEENPEAGVAPLRWSYEKVARPVEDGDCDYDACDSYNCWQASFIGDTGDGYTDLALKFDSVAVSSYLGTASPGCTKVRVIGTLKEDAGGQDFEGCDTLRIIVNKKAA